MGKNISRTGKASPEAFFEILPKLGIEDRAAAANAFLSLDTYSILLAMEKHLSDIDASTEPFFGKVFSTAQIERIMNIVANYDADTPRKKERKTLLVERLVAETVAEEGVGMSDVDRETVLSCLESHPGSGAFFSSKPPGKTREKFARRLVIAGPERRFSQVQLTRVEKPFIILVDARDYSARLFRARYVFVFEHVYVEHGNPPCFVEVSSKNLSEQADR